MDRRPVPDGSCSGRRGVGVEHGGEEDRRACRIEPSTSGASGGRRKPCSVAHRPTRGGAAAQDGDVERVDADLHQLLGRAGRRRGCWTASPRTAVRSRGSAAGASSRRPSTLDGTGEWRQRAECPAAAGELEGRDVVLRPIVIAGQRRRAQAGPRRSPISPPQANAGAADRAMTRRAAPRAAPARPIERIIVDLCARPGRAGSVWPPRLRGATAGSRARAAASAGARDDRSRSRLAPSLDVGLPSRRR